MSVTELNPPIRTALDVERVILAVMNYTDRPIRRASSGSVMSMYDLRYYFDNYVAGVARRGVSVENLTTSEIYMSEDFLDSLGFRMGMTVDNGALVLDQTYFDRKFGRGRLQQVIHYVERTNLTGTRELRMQHIEEDCMAKFDQVRYEAGVISPYLASIVGVVAGAIMEIELVIFAGIAGLFASGVRHVYRRRSAAPRA